MMRALILTLALCAPLSSGSQAADLTETPTVSRQMHPQITIKGRASVVDGRTLWFPERGLLVRLAQIDSCDLPQWGFDPKATAPSSPSLMPVPCGALAKAWLKKLVGNAVLTCTLATDGTVRPDLGFCSAGGRDLGLEMLRVGWARIADHARADRRYTDAERRAVSARYGMWGTYVLDMNEWRAKALDRTLGRHPQADANLLSERRREITPPFADARRQPLRRDR